MIAHKHLHGPHACTGSTSGNTIASCSTAQQQQQQPIKQKKLPSAVHLCIPLMLTACACVHSGLHCVQSPYHCNLLIAGFDEGAGASLYWVDYLATLHKVNTGGTGYGEQSQLGEQAS
jgi:hypothetical protein